MEERDTLRKLTSSDSSCASFDAVNADDSSKICSPIASLSAFESAEYFWNVSSLSVIAFSIFDKWSVPQQNDIGLQNATAVAKRQFKLLPGGDYYVCLSSGAHLASLEFHYHDAPCVYRQRNRKCME